MRSLRGVRRVLIGATAAAAVLGTTAAGAARSADPDPAAIDAIFSPWNGDTPGLALAVVRDERIIYSRGYGIANLDHAVPIESTTVFDVGSTSKQFTAACILLLAEEGKLAITDEVRKHIPELPEYEAPITIAHLLHHTSGLRDYLDIVNLSGLSLESDYSEEFLLKVICRQKGLNFPPGERFRYSNTGYFLLAQIVRRVGGVPLPQFAKERIFEPLGMTSTIFLDDHHMVVPRRAESYFPNGGAGGFQLSTSLLDCVGDGGVHTTVEDLAKWDANFYHNKLGAGKPELLDRMQEVGLFNNGQTNSYASGLFIGEHRGQRMVSHGGAWRGFRAEMIRFPDQKLSVICLANLGTINATTMALQVADLYLADERNDAGTAVVAGNGGPGNAAGSNAASPTPATPSDTATFAMPDTGWEKFLGRYKAEGGPIWTITRRGDDLAIASSSGLTFAARPVGGMEFESTDRPQLARLVFRADEGGKVAGLTQTITGTADVRLTPIEAVTDAAAGLADFEGTYDSEEVGGWMRVSVSGGQLRLTSTDDGEPFAVARYGRDGFSVPGFEAVFTRSNDGRVDGIVVSTQRAGGMRYVKRTGGLRSRDE